MEILDTRQNLNEMVLKHEQQIKDIAAHLLELRKWGSPMMEFKREKKEWVGLTGPEVDAAYKSVSDKEWAIGGLTDARVFFCAIEAKLKEKNT